MKSKTKTKKGLITMRNIKKQAEQGMNSITPNRDLTATELEQLKETFNSYKSFSDGLFYSLTEAFYAGVAVGIRQGKAAANSK